MQLKKVKELIEKDNINGAIEELQRIVKDYELQNEIIINSARLNSISKKARTGIVDFNTESREKNNIRFSLLQIIDELENPDNVLLSDKDAADENVWGTSIKPSSKKTLLLILILGIIISLTIFFSSRQNITGIKGNNNDNNKIQISN